MALAENISPQIKVGAQPISHVVPDEALCTKHINSLDGVRGMACLSILAVHAFASGPHEVQNAVGSIFQVAKAGWLGVDLFFVLSGFLITGILYEMKGKPNYFKNFYMRRSLRIFPLYYASLIFWILLVSPLRFISHTHFTPVLDQLWNNQLWYWCYVQNWAPLFGINMSASDNLLGPFWSLAIEEQFYLVWPLLVFLIPKKRLFVLCIAFIFLSMASRVWLISSGHDPTLVYRLTTSHLDGFAIGGIVSLYFRQTKKSKHVHLAALSTLLASLVFVSFVCLREGGFGYSSPFVCMWGYTIAALGFGSIVCLCTQSGSVFDRVFNGKILRLIGTYSYAIYLFHWPIFYVAQLIWIAKIGTNILWQILYLPALVAILLGLAHLSWTIFEQPFLKLKSRYA